SGEVGAAGGGRGEFVDLDVEPRCQRGRDEGDGTAGERPEEVGRGAGRLVVAADDGRQVGVPVERTRREAAAPVHRAGGGPRGGAAAGRVRTQAADRVGEGAGHGSSWRDAGPPWSV